ncbi:uncharacterized protein [Diabrotica undecimpunctata]|uniref:uncharacterized protein isoform X1 n=1 Tax=Diabrotica undecimpunctata TaxID=50387 RepID=UPI003B631DDD
MKYNTISSGSLGNERKSTLTIYADMDISPSKATYTEAEVTSIRGELEIVQKALKLQTRRCRQLVTEYTRRLQEKEHQYRSEKALRDDQLAKVLRALLIFEARLRQEQKFISRQLNEKDNIIKKQSNDIKKLLLNQYCKSCNQYYTSSPIQESLDSSTEYVLTDCQEYQSSNFESLDSSCETYATLSEKDNKSESSYEEISKSETESKNIYLKNRNRDSLGRRSKKIPHRKSIGTYFEVLKLRNDNCSPLSNDDNTSNDYDNLDSLPAETVTEKINRVSENIEHIFDKNKEILENNDESSHNVSSDECNQSIISKSEKDNISKLEKPKIEEEKKTSAITETIPVFEGGEEINENWYASASDQEDDEQRDIYRNNPVLECMNQILLQNINDSLNSPPKTPNIERKSAKNKRVKFSDEEAKEDIKEVGLTEENVKENENKNHDYYETPIQKSPNFYETPQSIYSNDYEQILSKCNETFSPIDDDNQPKSLPEHSSNYYIDMDDKAKTLENDNRVVKRSKILRTPPALPPKPVNLVSKYKIQGVPKTPPSDKSCETEPDYCSISELNLPQNKNVVSFKKINVVAEINAPTSLDVLSKINAPEVKKIEKQVDKDDMVVKKCVEKMNIQLAKQTPIKSESTSPKKKVEIEIPKLPQVSEILIPESEDEEKDKEDRINQDNYMRNNTQVLKLKTTRTDPIRKPIAIGSSVSSLINSFNNQVLNEIKHSPDKVKTNKSMFSSFESLQNLDKHSATSTEELKTPNFEKFDLSQNFEEFKLDDCEIEEYTVEEIKTGDFSDDSSEKSNSTRVDLIRATNLSPPILNRNSVELFKKQLELQKTQEEKNKPFMRPNEPTYEHFLECTGLSTKSILTPSRMLTNHKGMLKPKDVKLRSKVKSNNLFERHSTSTMKYWSEPYI